MVGTSKLRSRAVRRLRALGIFADAVNDYTRNPYVPRVCIRVWEKGDCSRIVGLITLIYHVRANKHSWDIPAEVQAFIDSHKS
jgi:hypothetical protein